MRRIHNIGTGAAVSNALNVEEQGMDPKQQGNTAATAPNSEAAAGTTAAAPAPAAATTDANAAVAERQRIAGILSCDEAKGREKLAQHFATQTDMSVDAARAALKVASVETAPNALNAAMAAHGSAGNKVGAAGSGVDATGASANVPPVIDANAIFKRRKVEAENARRKHGGNVA
jgi:hypothetical protein